MQTRRIFFRNLAGALGFGFIALESRLAWAKKLAVKIDKIPSLKKVGGSARVKLVGKEILLIRDSSTSVKGMGAKCTHKACDLSYSAKRGKIECTCHGSAFDLTGKVLSGPATQSLPVYPAQLSGDRIVLVVN